MKINDDTTFHWRNHLKPTPSLIYWLVTTAEAVVLAVNIREIFAEVNPWVITGLLVLQTLISKIKDFVGKIKDEYESKQKITVTATGDVEVKKETIESDV